jgi:flagellar export protein FliJ
MSGGLDSVLRLRQMALDEAKRELAECVQAVTEASDRTKAAASAIHRERAAAEALEAPDTAVEAFAAWLPRGLRAVDAAREAEARGEAALTQARVRVANARSAVEAIETVLREREEARQAELRRAEQAEMDEVGQRRRID